MSRKMASESAAAVAGGAAGVGVLVRMYGNRILILLDMSASMMDETLVNIIRIRNMPDEAKRAARIRKEVRRDELTRVS